MKRKYLLLTLAFLLGFTSLVLIEVRGLNYTPGVDVGDELIWTTQTESGAELDIIFAKYIITYFSDIGDTTRVYSDYSVSSDNTDYG